MIAYSLASTTQLLLPATNENVSSFNLIVYIRDSYDCVVEYHLEPVYVKVDSTEMDDLIKDIQNSTENTFVQLLDRGNQNIVSQVITSISQHLNTKNDQTMQTAVSSTFSLYIFDQYSIIFRWYFSVDHCHITIR